MLTNSSFNLLFIAVGTIPSTHLECVSVGEGFPAHLAMHGLIRCVQLLDVQAQVRLPATRGGAELALEDRLVPRVDEAVGLQRVALREPRVADVALVGLLPSVDAQVPLQLERVWRRVGAMRTLVRPLPRVAPHVPLQLGQFYTAVIALGAPEKQRCVTRGRFAFKSC